MFGGESFLIADPHFGHHGVCRFLRDDGSKLRPWDDVSEMDEEMVLRWNDTVRPTDKVYVAGDVVINRKSLSILPRLNGTKVLIKGNHDIFKMSDYAPHFKDIRAYHILGGCLISHIPVHEESLSRWKCNIHGHLHYRRVVDADGFIDPRYFCVSVEHIDYRPIHIEEVFTRIRNQQ
ncbi:MAG: hypothetical protein BV459_00215 [Thermoplasmata archaeon M11B2D]|nr:MAG: hypothetical protein BV459_00215 [Thermoplasmata archaeon M11B2D]